jgi:hypothetical protein
VSREGRRAESSGATSISPLPRHLTLWALFLALAVLSFFTVLWPELRSEQGGATRPDDSREGAATAPAESM